MSNQTLNKPAAKRRASTTAQNGKNTKNTARTGTYRKQTARLDGRKDGKPLIFGWGGHLTRMQKNRLQTRAAYGFFGVILVIVAAIFVFGVIQQNLIIPNQAIVKVNSVSISQDTYRKLLAYNAQDTWNQYQSLIKQQGQLATQVAHGDAAAVNQNQVLTAQIQTIESNYAQAQITQLTMDQLVEDQLIQQGIRQFEARTPALKSKLEPSNSAINVKLNSFKAAFPIGESYNDFLTKNHLSNDDVLAAVKLQLRRTLMQTYLSSLLVSPTRQVHYRRIETSNVADAMKVYNFIHNSKLTPDQAWSQAAKQYSLDPNSKNVGGDMGWVPPGTGDAGIELWAYASNRKVNDITTTPIKDSSGTFDVVQILEIAPSRAVDPTVLSNAQTNALPHWLSEQRANPANTFSTPDQTMMNATRNLPVIPSLSATLKTESTPSSSSIPGGGGLP